MFAWAFSERRRSRRYEVEWPGILHCLFPTLEESVGVTITEISATGARLVLDRLQIGPYNIALRHELPTLALSTTLPEGSFNVPVIKIRWYDMDHETRLFRLGVAFDEMKGESQLVLDRILETLK